MGARGYPDINIYSGDTARTEHGGEVVVNERVDKVLNVILALVALITAGSVVMLFVAVPAILSTRDMSMRASDLAQCRAEAWSSVESADTALDLAVAEMTAYLTTGTTQEIDDARETMRAASDALTAATLRYHDMITLSRTDPGAFLTQCDPATGG